MIPSFLSAPTDMPFQKNFKISHKMGFKRLVKKKKIALFYNEIRGLYLDYK